MPQLDISTYIPQVFWLAIIFSVMFGISIGLFLPRLSRIFQKRFDAAKQSDNKIQVLLEDIKKLQEKYNQKKEAAIYETQEHIDTALMGIREVHENRLQSLEREIQQELSYLRESYEQQYNDFYENYKDLINESATQILTKLRAQNGR